MVQQNGNSSIRLIVGLGNPGEQYAETRHNAGFIILDQFLGTVKGKMTTYRYGNSQVWEKRCRSKKILLQKPLTYMNRSGEMVGSLMRKQGITPEELLVVHDDLDLPLGRLRVRKQGSSGGHNGVQSVIDEIQSEAFPRMRVGIASFAESTTRDQVDFVLSPFSPEERPLWSAVGKMAADALDVILFRGIEQAMNDFNGRNIVIQDDKINNKTDVT